MKLYLALLSLALLVSAEAAKSHTTKNSHVGSRKLRIYPSVEEADYNTYVDNFLAEYSRIFNTNGDSVNLTDGEGQFEVEINGTLQIVDIVLTNGVFSGLANTSRVGDAIANYDNETDELLLEFGLSFDPAQVTYNFSIGINDGDRYEGSIGASVHTNNSLMGFLTDYNANDWVYFMSAFYVFDLDNYQISWLNEDLPEVSDGVAGSLLEALLDGSTDIHVAFDSYLDDVLAAVGLPPHP